MSELCLKRMTVSTLPTRRLLIEIERDRQLTIRRDLRLQVSDLLFRRGDRVGAGDEPTRRRLHAGNRQERLRELRGITRLPAVLTLPVFEKGPSAFVVVGYGRCGVVRRLFRQQFRAEESRIDDRRGDAERRDLGIQGLHPSFKTELRRGIRGHEVKTRGEPRG